MSFLDKNIKDFILPQTTDYTAIVFECDKLDYYDFPLEEDIPEGLYAAKVMGFQESTDKFNKQYTDVCYKIFSHPSFERWNRKMADQITYFYIRISFLKKGNDERRFRAAMSSVCKKKKFSADDLIDAIVLIRINYKNNGEACVVQYQQTELNDLWFVDDLCDDFHWSSGYGAEDE